MSRPFSVQRIDHVVFRVRDLDRSVEFYRHVLGCDVVRARTDLGLVHLRAGASMIDLVSVDGKLGLRGGAAPNSQAKNVDHLCLRIEPFSESELISHLNRHGLSPLGSAAINFGAEGDGLSLYFPDPDGNVIELKGPPTEKETAMSSIAKNTRSTVVPCLRYRDAPKAIEWLCSVFGFEEQLVVPNDDGGIAHAQLSFGNGMVMLGSVSKVENEFGRLTKQPDEIGGMETQSPYLIVSDADAVYQRAKTAGAKIEIEIKDEDYGGRGFSCRDLEGHLWNVGTYDPW